MSSSDTHTEITSSSFILKTSSWWCTAERHGGNRHHLDVLAGQKDPKPAKQREGEILAEEAEASSSGKGPHRDTAHSTKI